MLQELKKADELVKRLEQKARPPAAPVQPVDMLAEADKPPTMPARIGAQLGEEVVQMMFEHLLEDRRLLPALKRELKTMQPAVHRLTKEDSRFFSDRTHPARQVLDRITQRSLAFTSEQDPGWDTFIGSVHSASKWLESKVVDAETFKELLQNLQEQWKQRDPVVLYRARLKQFGIGEGAIVEIENDVRQMVDAATEKCKASGPPPLDILTTDVYADGGFAWRN